MRMSKVFLMSGLASMLALPVFDVRADDDPLAELVMQGDTAAAGELEATAPVEIAQVDPFAGLISGEPVPDEDLAQFFGAAILHFTVSDGSLINQNGSVDVSQLNTSGIDGSSGIVTVTQFQGDNNNVSLNIHLEVNINTVTVTNSNGSSINVTNTFDMNGVLGNLNGGGF